MGEAKRRRRIDLARARQVPCDLDEDALKVFEAALRIWLENSEPGQAIQKELGYSMDQSLDALYEPNQWRLF
jgi:hypothetical protein